MLIGLSPLIFWELLSTLHRTMSVSIDYQKIATGFLYASQLQTSSTSLRRKLAGRLSSSPQERPRACLLFPSSNLPL